MTVHLTVLIKLTICPVLEKSLALGSSQHPRLSQAALVAWELLSCSGCWGSYYLSLGFVSGWSSDPCFLEAEGKRSTWKHRIQDLVCWRRCSSQRKQSYLDSLVRSYSLLSVVNNSLLGFYVTDRSRQHPIALFSPNSYSSRRTTRSQNGRSVVLL